MNDLDLCLEVVSRICQPLHYIRRWISRKPLEIEAWFQRTTNRKWHMGYQMVTWPMTSRDSQRCCEEVRSAILATAWLLVYVLIKLVLVLLLFGCVYMAVRMFPRPILVPRVRPLLCLKFWSSFLNRSTKPEWLHELVTTCESCACSQSCSLVASRWTQP